jgi:hypothetical protein
MSYQSSYATVNQSGRMCHAYQTTSVKLQPRLPSTVDMHVQDICSDAVTRCRRHLQPSTRGSINLQSYARLPPFPVPNYRSLAIARGNSPLRCRADSSFFGRSRTGQSVSLIADSSLLHNNATKSVRLKLSSTWPAIAS